MSTYSFFTVEGPTGPIGPQGVTGPKGNIDAGDNLNVNTIACSDLEIDNLHVAETVIVSSAILGPTTLPVFTADMIGFTTYKTGSSVTITNGNVNYALNDEALVLPAGVWILDVVCQTAATGSNYTINGFYIGVTETLNTNTYSNGPNGLRFTKNVGSWNVVYNDTRFRPMFKYNQVYHVTSGTKSLYGFFQLNGGSGSGTLSVSGSVHATRIS